MIVASKASESMAIGNTRKTEDQPPLQPEKLHGAQVMVDDAHAMGVLGGGHGTGAHRRSPAGQGARRRTRVSGARRAAGIVTCRALLVALILLMPVGAGAQSAAPPAASERVAVPEPSAKALAYRRSGNRGNEYFLIFGDPNSKKFRSTLVLKFVMPVELR